MKRPPSGAGVDRVSSATDPLIVLTTTGTIEDARKLAGELVERQLAACVNIVDSIESVYRWEGRVTTERERLLLIKTTRARLADLQTYLMSAHLYEVPEYLVVPIDAISPAYQKWLVESTNVLKKTGQR